MCTIFYAKYELKPFFFSHFHCMTCINLDEIINQINQICWFSGDKRTNVCGAGSINCYKTAKQKLFGQDLIDGLQDMTAKTFRKKCYCLPACTSITYDIRMDKSKYDWSAVLSARQEENDHLLGYEICFFLLFF